MRVLVQERRGCKECWGKGIRVDGLREGQIRNVSDVFLIREVWRNLRKWKQVKSFISEELREKVMG